MLDFRLPHLRGDRKSIQACSHCHYVQGVHPMNDMDDVAADLIQVYQS